MKLFLVISAVVLASTANAKVTEAIITFNRDFVANEYVREGGGKFAFYEKNLFQNSDCYFVIVAEKEGATISKGTQLTYKVETARPYLDSVSWYDRTYIPSNGGTFGVTFDNRYDTEVGISGRIEQQNVSVMAACRILTAIPFAQNWLLPSRAEMIENLKPYFSYTETQKR